MHIPVCIELSVVRANPTAHMRSGTLIFYVTLRMCLNNSTKWSYHQMEYRYHMAASKLQALQCIRVVCEILNMETNESSPGLAI